VSKYVTTNVRFEEATFRELRHQSRLDGAFTFDRDFRDCGYTAMPD